MTTKEEGEIIYVDQGLSIMVQLNLRIASEENIEDWLRKNVFHTKMHRLGQGLSGHN